MEKKKRKINIGVEGMEQLIFGGLPKGKIIMVSGSSGTGKTIFASQFIKKGVEDGDKCVYLTLEQSKEKLMEDMIKMGIDFRLMEKKGKLKLIGGPLGDISYFKDKTKAKVSDIVGELKEVILETGAKRVVLDSVNLFTMLFDDNKERRKAMAELVALLDELGCSAVLTCEVREGTTNISWHGFEEFVVDGVIVLYRLPFGNLYERAVSIVKMRGCKHSQRVCRFQINGTGVKVLPDKEPYQDVLRK
jgi:KaiC/GvpD/RAD55 family RecA-like ATPase